MLGKLWNKLTGARPMRIRAYAFTDQVSGRAVYYVRCRAGRLWLAQGRWSRFRVAKRG